MRPAVDGARTPQVIRASECKTRPVGARSIVDELAQVVERGAPAQRLEAERLAAILATDETDPKALDAARHLIDAYLNDPYLERGEE